VKRVGGKTIFVKLTNRELLPLAICTVILRGSAAGFGRKDRGLQSVRETLENAISQCELVTPET
jgi:hypothetical protein